MIFLTIVVKELLHKAINNIVFGQQLKPTYQGIQAWHRHFGNFQKCFGVIAAILDERYNYQSEPSWDYLNEENN